MDQILQTVREAKEWLARLLSSLSPQQRSFLFRGLPALLLTLGVGAFSLLREYYSPLFPELSVYDAASVVKELDAQKIPYQLRGNGSVIEVPRGVLQRTRLALAGKGLGLAGGVGFEIFEDTPFGVTEFTQRVNYLRALQGELSRTISGLESVRTGRVHLALPLRSSFLGQEETVSASVVVGLYPGYQLNPKQVRGIVNLVSNSVPRLAPERVSVVDATGMLLQAGGGFQKDESSMIYRLRLELERAMEERIVTMLEPVLGPNKVVARVSLDVDFRQTELTREEFDPSGRVIRSQTSELDEAEVTDGGVPGVQANIPGGEAESSTGSPNRRKSNAVTYEVGRTTSRVSEPRGKIRRLSIAVMVDGNYDDGVYVPLASEEIQKLTTIIKTAVGFNAKRGDELELTNIPFKEVPATAVAPGPVLDLRQWLLSPQIIKIGGGALLVLLILLILWISLGRRKPQPVPQERIQLPVEQAREEVEKDISGAVEKITITSDPRQEQLVQIARDYKDVTVQILRMWLREGRKVRPDEEETSKPE